MWWGGGGCRCRTLCRNIAQRVKQKYVLLPIRRPALYLLCTMRASVALATMVLAALASPALSCTNMLVDPSASADGSSIIAYNADSATVYGMLYHYPAADHGPNVTRAIYNWDSGAYLGTIPEAAHTYNVVGNTNEYGVTIGETTFGGISLLGPQAAARVDYGAVIWVTLQRARTATHTAPSSTSPLLIISMIQTSVGSPTEKLSPSLP